MSNIDAMIMNAANTAAQQTQQTQQVQGEYIPAQQFQQPAQGEYIPAQQGYQQQVAQQQFQQPQQQFQQPQQQFQQQQFQQPQVAQQQFQQSVVQQQPFQQPVVQQQQFQQPQQQQFQQSVAQQQQFQQPQQPAGMINHQAANAVAVQQPQQAQFQQPMMAGQLPAHLMQMPTSLNMETFMNMGISVDLWLKPDYVGMTIGENATPVESIIVEIDMTEHVGFTPIFGIRFGANPVKYDYTRDGVTNKDGLSWQAALYQAYQIDPTVSPYRAVQIPMIVLQECKNLKQEVVAPAGASVGYTTSVTNFTQWEELYRNCMRQNLIGHKVAVKLTNIPKAKNNNKWGVVHFELLGASAAFKAA